jgi:hypothetical protein
MPASAARVVTASGPRAAEELLLGALEADQREVRADLSRLGRPLYVLVPSKSLRLALLERLAARGDGVTLGVEVVTLHHFARLLHERAGVAWPRGESLLPILARRLAPAHPELADLAPSRDGLAALAEALRDLQHAGFTPELAEPLEECLAELEGHPGLPRARALLALAARLQRELAAAGCAPAGGWATSAARLVRERPELACARAIWIHGFQDAPGTTSELLGVLAERAGAQVVFDDLALALDAGPTGTRYGEALAQRLGVPAPASHPRFARQGSALGFIEAFGPKAEARAVATVLRERIANGARPERLAVVARNLAGIGGELAAALRGLGVPFSGLGAQGSLTSQARAAHALAELVELGPRAHVVRALRAGWSLPPTIDATAPELLAACGLLGATRISALLELDLGNALGGADSLRLPGGRGRARPDEEAEDDGDELDEELPVESAPPELEPGRDFRRLVPLAALEWIRGQALGWTRGLAALPGRGRASEFVPAFEALVRSQFPGLAELSAGVARALARDLPEECLLAQSEFLELAASALREAPHSPLGGAGGGVQLLEALEARSRSFDDVFLVDLCQGAFPRAVREEPILPDRLRGGLRAILPDLPQKSAALSEEEALFAGLLESAPRATLSWTRTDAEGKARLPSPFLRRAFRECRGEELAPGRVPLASLAPARAGDPPTRMALARTEHEELVRSATLGGSGFAAGLEELLAAQGRPAAAARTLARARLAVLEELEPSRSRPAYPNAYLGSVGSRLHPAEARKETPWVSALEALANCPWQMFLGRVLGLAPAVPVRDLGAVLEAAHVGSVVHGVLAAIVKRRGGAWPDERGLRELCAEEAQALVRAEHLAPAGLSRVLALRSLGFLEVARRLDGPPSRSRTAEVESQLRFDERHTLPFRADRVDERAEGAVWIDFKTSRHPLSEAVKPETREKHMRAAVREGAALQAATYAFAATPPATGRYLYLHPRIDESLRAQDAPGGDPALRRDFDAALARLYAAWEEGAFPPRLVARSLRDEHKGCKSCEFQAACQRGDSGMRTRTVQWLRDDSAAPAMSGFVGALQGLWRLKLDRPQEAQ